MLLSLRPNLSEAQLAPLREVARRLGAELCFLDERRLLAELRPERSGALLPPEARTWLGDLSCVAAVLEATDAPERHERRGRADLLVEVGPARFGGNELALVAGPCAVEGEASLVALARDLAARGATLLRGGAYKPRTSPYSFQGLGPSGLELLANARQQSGLAILTEVLDPRDVEAVGRVADAFQIGARSMHNSALLKEVGRSGKPVLLKRSFGASLREFLLAAEYVLATGNSRVILCERGVRGFDGTTRNLLDVGVIAHLERATHLPVIADPSHAAGRADLVRPLARAALAAGARGLLIEVHDAPHEALSDGGQAISRAEFSRLVEDARALGGLLGRRLATLPTAAVG
jgi:3-deoxy-7-phosphoheptulonate synthase